MEDTTMKFQSTLPIQGETKRDRVFYRLLRISIHSPYTGRDIWLGDVGEDSNISIHSPYTGRDAVVGNKATIVDAFQSTLPIQGETVIILSNSIFIIFQSTLPIQGETASWHTNLAKSYISIHSPYTGRDKFCPGCGAPVEHFNPLSLYRERLFQLCSNRRRIYFNPLSLYRERLLLSNSLCVLCFISIHSPYTGRDRTSCERRSAWAYFNPLSLYRERRYKNIKC